MTDYFWGRLHSFVICCAGHRLNYKWEEKWNERHQTQIYSLLVHGTDDPKIFLLFRISIAVIVV